MRKRSWALVLLYIVIVVLLVHKTEATENLQNFSWTVGWNQSTDPNGNTVTESRMTANPSMSLYQRIMHYREYPILQPIEVGKGSSGRLDQVFNAKLWDRSQVTAFTLSTRAGGFAGLSWSFPRCEEGIVVSFKAKRNTIVSITNTTSRSLFVDVNVGWNNVVYTLELQPGETWEDSFKRDISTNGAIKTLSGGRECTYLWWNRDRL